MSGGKGGSQTTSVQIPKWLETAAQGNLARADDISKIGYTPYYGPEVAAFTPMQEASFAGTGQAAGAFGLPGGGMTGMEGMPQPQTYAGGVQGYSSAPMYEESLGLLRQNAPGQYDYIRGMFIDPVTGAPAGGNVAPLTDAAATVQKERSVGLGGIPDYGLDPISMDNISNIPANVVGFDPFGDPGAAPSVNGAGGMGGGKG